MIVSETNTDYDTQAKPKSDLAILQGQRIKKAMQYKQCTRKDICDLYGENNLGNLSQVCAGKVRTLHPNILRKIADYTGVRYEYIIGKDEFMTELEYTCYLSEKNNPYLGTIPCFDIMRLLYFDFGIDLHVSCSPFLCLSKQEATKLYNSYEQYTGLNTYISKTTIQNAISKCNSDDLLYIEFINSRILNCLSPFPKPFRHGVVRMYKVVLNGKLYGYITEKNLEKLLTHIKETTISAFNILREETPPIFE